MTISIVFYPQQRSPGCESLIEYLEKPDSLATLMDTTMSIMFCWLYFVVVFLLIAAFGSDLKKQKQKKGKGKWGEPFFIL